MAAVSKIAVVLSCVLALGLQCASAQSGNSDFDEFRRQIHADLNAFRTRANREYAAFLEHAWTSMNSLRPRAVPVIDDLPPVSVEQEPPAPVDDLPPVVVKRVVEARPLQVAPPEPVEPIREESASSDENVPVLFYGTPLNIRWPSSIRLNALRGDEQSVSRAWLDLSRSGLNNTIVDCLRLREELGLCDWAYLALLENFASCVCADDNGRVLIMSFIYCQSGYAMRLVFAAGKLRMMFASRHVIFGLPYLQLNGVDFYPYHFDTQSGNLKVCGQPFPGEKPLSLSIGDVQRFSDSPSQDRLLQARRYADFKVVATVNTNLMDFFADYPTSMIDGDDMTRWAMYAAKPMDALVAKRLYPQLRTLLNGLSSLEAMERLLNFVQTAFEYEFDEVVWGEDRAFFPEETLFYPYCDCEDRSILLARLVKDLLGLEVVLLYYPEHVSMAVELDEPVDGKRIEVKGKTFVECDPTYINATVGMTMSRFASVTPDAILLR